MEPVQSLLMNPPKSLPNFRCLNWNTADANRKNVIYRSSRPDFVDGNDLKLFNSYGIRTIIDCRSKAQYKMATDPKKIDNYYEFYSVVLPKERTYKPKEAISCLPINKDSWKNGRSVFANDMHRGQRKRYLINFFGLSHGKAIFSRASVLVKLSSLFVLLFDMLFRTGYIYFLRLLAYTNKARLEEFYEEIADLSKTSICAALRLLTNEDNYPVMINCAHGKDRTGILSALVLHIMGEDEDSIVQDYAKSQDGLAPVRERVYKEIVEYYYWDKSFCDANPNTMRHLLTYIKQRYGSIDNYLENIGFCEEEQEKLRRFLTDDTPSQNLDR